MFRFSLMVLFLMLTFTQNSETLNYDYWEKGNNFVKEAAVVQDVHHQYATPGELLIEPRNGVILNIPLIDKYRVPLRITNDDRRQIGWAITTNRPARICADSACGVLGAMENTTLYIAFEPFDYNSTKFSTEADRITIAWVLTPEGFQKKLKREWFQGDRSIRRKSISLIYNV